MQPELEIKKYINLITEKLRDGREYGRASVLIGAGFSRNAKKCSPSTTEFPQWDDLADLMRKKLNSNCSYDSLITAQAFEATYGRLELENFVRQNIPDDSYSPSDIHVKLLQLPWSDVFTTNYDTLLERTRPFIVDRKYCLVENQFEISTTIKPRIVKLHGSFSASTKLILTEEDYRCYPHKHAPFVNLVQQSLMENLFCLIGFSGKDPNFLKWTGWVKDFLGDLMPRIYMIGVFDFKDSEIKYFESRNIVPVDLSCISPDVGLNSNNERNRIAIDWFLSELNKNSIPKAILWPRQSKDQKNEIIFDRTKKEDLIKLLKQWELERQTYPGWVIMPFEKISSIWDSTWIQLEHVESIDSLEFPDDLMLLYELSWRIEKSLIPLYGTWLPIENWLKTFQRILDRYNSYFDENKPKPDINQEKHPELNWSILKQYWIDIYFFILKNARLELNEKLFIDCLTKIEKHMHQNKNWQIRNIYESARFALSKIDISRTNGLAPKIGTNFLVSLDIIDANKRSENRNGKKEFYDGANYC